MNSSRTNIIVASGCAVLFVAANAVLFATGRFPVIQDGLPDWTATCGLIVAAFITFAMFSLVYEDNPIFRAVENLFVGLGLGVSFYGAWYVYLKPSVYDPLLAPLLSPTASVPPHEWLLLIPIVMGLMILTRVSRSYGWISRYPIAFLVGYGAGFGIQPTIHSFILKQVETTVQPVTMAWQAWVTVGVIALAFIAGAYVASQGGRSGTVAKIAAGIVALLYVILRSTAALTDGNPDVQEAFVAVDAILVMLGTVSVLCYFFFSAEHKGVLGAASRIGVIFLMISFGASFGYTVMARESLLIGRFQFLLGDWLGLL